MKTLEVRLDKFDGPIFRVGLRGKEHMYRVAYIRDADWLTYLKDMY